MIALVAAIAENGVIGRDNGLPWHIPEDLKHFKMLTLGKPVIMGRKTFDSIGKPLKDRTNIVISRNKNLRLEGAEVVTSLAKALARASELSPDIMIIGGAQIYAEALPKADRLYLTYVHTNVEGDTFFPSFDPANWCELERTRFFSPKAGLEASFVVLEKSRSQPIRQA
jgi:dihydrofolate reductase